MVDKETYLDTGKNYYSLSLKDLLEARDAYHVFLTRKKNVIGTAISKYRWRNDKDKKNEPKTLTNTYIDKYSWPCIMVFVKEWITEKEFRSNFDRLGYDFIPDTLYLSDGREIPVCVIKADWQSKGRNTVIQNFSTNIAGGGYPVKTLIQGEERIGTLGCLVSDGRLTYGLTNAHVAGKPGQNFIIEVMDSIKKNKKIKVEGIASEKQKSKVPFTEIYENLPGKHVMINLDIGLIEFKDISHVSSKIYSIGKVTGIADINHDTLSLKLIGCPVKGCGAVSGLMYGQIAGLFYRYTFTGGYDYVADYLVVPRKKEDASRFAPNHGDSGTLFVVDDADSNEDMKAIGILWGGQEDTSNGPKLPAGLMTNLGTICQKMDIELIGDWNARYDNYFGQYAHIVLPSLCFDVIKNEKLKELMDANAQNISQPLEGVQIGKNKKLDRTKLIPLADVPDLIWSYRVKGYVRGNEGPNHFADMDKENNNGETLMKLCENYENINPTFWLNYYKDTKVDQGALPFRVAQIFDAMVKSVKNKNVTEFVCAAGIVPHYIFDACLPTHITYMHHGNPAHKQPGKSKPIGEDIHDVFDNLLIEKKSEDIIKDLPGLVDKRVQNDDFSDVLNISTVKQVACAVVDLMKKTVESVEPKDIVAFYENLLDKEMDERLNALWHKYKNMLMNSMANGVVFTARLWEAAWKAGNGNINISVTKKVAEKDLMKLYLDQSFLPSYRLKKYQTKFDWK
jgi:hypothetical protein